MLEATTTLTPKEMQARHRTKLRIIGLSLIAVALAMLAPSVWAQGGSFMPDTSAFVRDVRESWNFVALIVMFAGLGLLVIGMLIPMASWMKWAAIGGIMVGAFGETVATYFFELSGQNRGANDPTTLQQSGGN